MQSIYRAMEITRLISKKKKFKIVFSEGCTSEIANLGKQTFNMM